MIRGAQRCDAWAAQRAGNNVSTVRVRVWAAATAAALIAAAGGGLWLTARRITSGHFPAVPLAPEIKVRFERVVLRGRAQGDRRWELHADSVQVTRDQRLTRLDGVRQATLYAGDKPELSVKAKWAQLESPSRDMELGGGVEMRSSRGLVLRTERLRWRAQQERLDSAGAVKLTIGDTRPPEPSGRASISAPHACYLAQRQQVVCDGGVTIEQGAGYLGGERLTADLAAQTLELAGGVRMRLRVSEGQELAGTVGPLEALPGLLDKPTSPDAVGAGLPTGPRAGTEPRPYDGPRRRAPTERR